MILSALPVIGKVAESILSVIDQAVEDKDQAARLRQQVEMELLRQDFSMVEKEIEARASIISAEARGEGALQRNWRPVLMLTFTYIIAHNHIVSPLFGLPRLEIPPDMWELLRLGMGGYIIGRTVEKGIDTWKKS